MIVKTWISREEALAILNLADESQLNSELADMVKIVSEKKLEEMLGYATFVQVVVE